MLLGEERGVSLHLAQQAACVLTLVRNLRGACLQGKSQSKELRPEACKHVCDDLFKCSLM